MAFRTTSLRHLNFVQFQKHGIRNSPRSLLHSVYGVRRCTDSNVRQERTKLKILKRTMSIQSMKELLKFSRPMSQSSKVDPDTERMRRAFERSSQQERTGDGNSRLIYEVRGLGMMRFCTVFFYVTSLAGLYMSPGLISTALEHNSVNGEMIMNVVTLVTAVAVMPTLLTMFNKRLVLRLYYNSAHKSYVAMTQTPILTLKRLHFFQDDVVPTKKKGPILGLFNLNTLRAKGHPYFVNAYNFKIPSDYNNLMGYK